MKSHTLLDELIPSYDVASRHSIRVAAEPAHVYTAARHADLSGPWLVRLLMGLRAGPAWLVAAFHGRPVPRASTGGQPWVRPVAFTLIAELPGQEFVLGIMAVSGRRPVDW
jgi:hypothetical protein